jgi:hypothetical protein
MLKYTFKITFPEPNGLVKEAEMQHTIPYQLNQLAKFWSTQHGITVERHVNESNSEKTMIYTVPTIETKEQYEQHAIDNGVDLREVLSLYQIEIEKLGGTLELTVDKDI